MPNTVPDSSAHRAALHVAVGVILGADHKVLLSKRAQNAHQGGLWEFPGGKVDSGETVAQALLRELEEELGIRIHLQSIRPLIQVSHDYGDRQVLLDVWTIDEFSGEPSGQEGQLVEWVALGELGQRDFPAANAPIVQAVQRLN